MNKIRLRYLFLYVLMAVFIAPAVANITRTFGVQPAELTQSQILYSDSIDYFLGGSLLLKNGQTDKYLFDGGYVRSHATTGNFSFFYYNKDHLGNNREVVNASGNVQQVTNYYPFGAPYADPVAVMNASYQPYKYNGKELDTMHGLNTYDYGARQYDPILARWDRMDPLCEKYYSFSPYAYCENDPINSIDPDGRIGLKLLLKGAYKVGKTVAKNGLSSLAKSTTYATAFKDVVDDAKTVLDSNASTLDRTLAGFSLLSEVVSPVTFKEAKKVVKKTYQTYIKTNPITKQKYIGRTSGTGTPLENIQKRDRNHHMNKKGFGPAELDKSSDNPDAIRGQEQYQIEQNGGAQSQGGNSGNAINGVSPRNTNKERYEQARKKEFGE